MINVTGPIHTTARSSSEMQSRIDAEVKTFLKAITVIAWYTKKLSTRY